MSTAYTYSEKTVAKVEFLIPRLKHSVYPTKIIKWLENFDEEDIPSALDFLSIFEYIGFSEFMSRLNGLLKELLSQIPKGEQIIIFPYGKVGKSGTLVTYPLKNTNSFQKRKNDILLTHDFKFIKDSANYKHIIFLDDFIGSGNTFCDEFIDSEIGKWLDENKIYSRFILCAIIMSEGRKTIKKSHPDIKIIADEREKLFDNKYSPFNAFNSLTYDRIKLFIEKYGKVMKLTNIKNEPLGYDNTESCIAFFHGTPNNTFPIIWDNRGWTPLYPRSSETRMSEAKELKKDITYYINIAKKLNIDIVKGISILNDKQKSQKIDHAELSEQNPTLITLLYLINKEYENIFICQILGLTREEIRDAYDVLIRKDLIMNDYKSITLEGKILLHQLSKITKKEKIRNETTNNLEIKNYLYLPQMFKGMT